MFLLLLYVAYANSLRLTTQTSVKRICRVMLVMLFLPATESCDAA